MLYLYIAKQKEIIRRYKVIEVLKFLKEDGWVKIHQSGSHRQFRHPAKKGKVTVNGKGSDDLSQEILNSIWKQAGWK